MASKKIRADVERLDGGDAVLDLEGKQIRWPRALLPGRVIEGDVLVFDISVDHSRAARAEVEAELDAGARRLGAGTRRATRNPRQSSARKK